jgi:signal transduction histidine kinase
VRAAPAVLIITDDANFARDLPARWRLEKNLPGITVMSTELMKAPAVGSVDVLIVGPVRHGRLAAVLRAVETGPQPTICVVSTLEQLNSLKADHPRLLALHQHEAWLDTVVMLASECLRRVDLAARLRKAEHAAVANARHAALGRYMLEARHDFNNSLTSVLGNAELLLLNEAEAETGAEAAVPALWREQLNTIQEMALHMHVIMQRFASLAMQTPGSEKESQDETQLPSHASFAAL